MAASRKSRSASTRRGAAAEPLLCPRCARRHALDERLCAECGMPLVYARGEGERAGTEPEGEARAYARKIRPELAQGDLVRVAGGRNQAEAELIRNLLIEEGVPSMLRRSAGFDVPDFLAAGERDVLVPHSGAEHARAMLSWSHLGEPDPPGDGAPAAPTVGHAARLAAVVLGGGAGAAVVAWIALRLAG